MKKTIAMKKTVVAAALAAGILPLSAQADTIFGIYAGAAQWTQEYSGTFGSSDSNAPEVCAPGCIETIDLNNTLGLDEEKGNTLWVAVEHPIPLLPNIKLERNELKANGRKETASDIYFGDEPPLEAGTVINTEFDLSHSDYVLYYELLDNWVSVDFGIDVKQFDGKISLSNDDATLEEELDAPIPMLYLAAKFDLPLTGLSFGAQGSGISAGGASLKDIRFNVAYEFTFGLGIEAGHRNMTIEIDPDEEDVFGDLEFKGNYVAATFHF